MIIEVKNLRRSFRSVKKEPGLSGTFKTLWKPQYQAVEALKGITLSIEEGLFVGLIGANGAGKTTLLKVLSGLIPPSSGYARVMGCEPFKREIKFRKSISLVMGQKAQLWWDLPALDAFELLKAIYEIPSDKYQERLHHLTELLDVKPLLNTQIRRLSLGERMKMELIGAILHWPKVIFLDEPTIGLDVLAAHKLREFLKEHNQRERATILLTSHNMDDIERLCSRVLIIRSGELIYDGMPQGLTRKGERRLRVHFSKPVSMETLLQSCGLPQDKIENPANEERAEFSAETLYYMTLEESQQLPALQAIASRLPLLEFGFEETSLETVIKRLYES